MTLKEMTPEKSIKTINSECENTTMLINASGEFAWALAKAISALEKQIPKKPIPQIVKGGKRLIGNGWWGEGTTVYRCPNCNEFISRTYDYCYKCGQALDWSDTECPITN